MRLKKTCGQGTYMDRKRSGIRMIPKFEFLPKGCNRSAYFWELGWAWFGESSGQLTTGLFCPDCIVKLKKELQESEMRQKRWENEKQIAEKNLVASLGTEEGCTRYIKKALDINFGSDHSQLNKADFERLDIALNYAFTQLPSWNDDLLRAVGKLYPEAVGASLQRQDNAYDGNAELGRARGTEWTQIRHVIERHIPRLTPSLKHSLCDSIRLNLNMRSEPEKYYEHLHNRMVQTALRFLDFIASQNI